MRQNGPPPRLTLEGVPCIDQPRIAWTQAPAGHYPVAVLAFIDESGYALPSDASPWSTLAAVCVPEAASREMNRRLYAKVRAVYPNSDPLTIEIKAANLLNRHQFERSPQRQAMVAELIQLFESTTVSVFAIRIRRPIAKPNWPAKRVDPPTRLLLERIELHMRAEHPGQFAKLVFDEMSVGTDAARSAAMRTFMHATDEGKSCRQVLDFPFFVSSSDTPGIQMADIMAGAIRHYQILRDARVPMTGPWESAIGRIQQIADRASKTFQIGGLTYPGLYTMPDSYFAVPPRRGRL